MQSLIPWRKAGGDVFSALQKEIDRAFDTFRVGFPEEERMFVEFNPRVELVDTPEGYEMTAELPGMTAKDVHCQIDGNLLTLKGEKKDVRDEKKKGWHYTERRYGKFERSFTLPAEILSDKIMATFKDGVLIVKLPKTPEAVKATKAITIKSE